VMVGLGICFAGYVEAGIEIVSRGGGASPLVGRVLDPDGHVLGVFGQGVSQSWLHFGYSSNWPLPQCSSSQGVGGALSVVAGNVGDEGDALSQSTVVVVGGVRVEDSCPVLALVCYS